LSIVNEVIHLYPKNIEINIGVHIEVYTAMERGSKIFHILNSSVIVKVNKMYTQFTEQNIELINCHDLEAANYVLTAMCDKKDCIKDPQKVGNKVAL
jgi:hypothetical protein